MKEKLTARRFNVILATYQLCDREAWLRDGWYRLQLKAFEVLSASERNIQSLRKRSPG